MLKKIETQADMEKKKRRTNIVIGIIIVALMVFSSVGYALLENNSGNQNKYGNYKFTQTSNGWQVTLKNYNLNLDTTYLPQEVLNYSGTGTSLSYYSNKAIYTVVTSQQDIQLASEILVNLNGFASRIQFACPHSQENSSFCQSSNLPLKDCSDADLNTAIIVIDSNSTVPSYNYSSSCLTLKGQGSDFIKMSDNFLFKLFGIIQ